MQQKSVSPLVSLLLLTGIFYLNFCSRIILAPLLPQLEQDLHLSHGAAGAFFLIMSCGYFLSLLGSGFVSSRLNHKVTIITSMVAVSVSLALVGMATDLLLTRVGFFLLGLAAGLYLPSAIATISDLFRADRWGRAFGLHELAPNLAFLTAPLITAWLLPLITWHQILYILTTTGLLMALIYAILGRGSHLHGAPPELNRCRSLMGQRDFWILVLLFAMGITGTVGVYSILPTFLVSEHGMTKYQASMLVGMSRITTLVTALLGGILADRFGNRRTMASVLLLTGTTTACLGLSATALVSLWVWLQPVLAVCFFPPAFAMLSRIGSAETRNVVISLAIPLSFVLGGGLIPAAIGRLADYGHFHLALTLTGVFIASGSVIVRFLAAEKNQQVPAPG